MCGRFENKRTGSSLVEMFGEIGIDLILDDDIKITKNENIAPTEKISAVQLIENSYYLKKINWGIKFNSDFPLIFNSRIETIKEKKYWQTLFDKNRCIVPMSGFYEWKKEGTKKVPYKISLENTGMFFVPALFFSDKQKNISASLITTTPNKFIKNIHHRMPVIFNITQAVSFLNNSLEENLSACLPLDDSSLMQIEKAKI